MDEMLPEIRNASSLPAPVQKHQRSSTRSKTRTKTLPSSSRRTLARKSSPKQRRRLTNDVKKAPRRKPRLSPVRKGAPEAGETEEVRAPSPERDRMSFCLEALTEGFVNTFVEFFYLTHEVSGNEGPTDATELEFVKNQLTLSEASHRQGDSIGMYNAYKRIGDRYQTKEEFTTAVYFFEKCLEIAVMMSDAPRQSVANHDLGVAFNKLGDMAASIRFHERHLEIAREYEDAKGAKVAGTELVKMYKREADDLEASDKEQEAIECLLKCLDAAMTAEDAKAEGLANHRLGLAMVKLGSSDSAISYEQNYLQICEDISDRTGVGEAHAALALAYTQMNQNATAIKSLQAFLKISTETDDKVAQSRACGSLGLAFSLEGDHERAVEFLERNYNIVRGLGDRGALDLARIQLGRARGDMMFAAFLETVKSDISSLLQWKGTRSGINVNSS